MRALLCLALVCPACEMADSAELHGQPPTTPPVAKPLPKPPEASPPRVVPPDIVVDESTHFGPPIPTPVADGLPPSPITDRTVYDPSAYDAWVAKLTPAQKRQVGKICRENPVDFQPECDGIGPLHIPVPPQYKLERHPPAFTAFASESEWEFVVTAAQHHYIETHCLGEMTPTSDLCGENTPLVISFDAAPVAYTTGARFAFAPGEPVTTDWPTARTPWLALDRDGNGKIDCGEELFGDHTLLPDTHRARDGFEALAALDDNHDGRIDAADPAFASLVLWGDDLRPASTVIDSISLAVTRELRCDARGNCEGARADIRWHDERGEHAGAIVDVYLPER